MDIFVITKNNLDFPKTIHCGLETARENWNTERDSSRYYFKGTGKKQRNCSEALEKLRAPFWKYCELSAARNWNSTANLCFPEMSVKVRTSLSALRAETWNNLYYSVLKSGGKECKVLEKKDFWSLNDFYVRADMCGCLEWWVFESCTEGNPCHEEKKGAALLWKNRTCCQERTLWDHHWYLYLYIYILYYINYNFYISETKISQTRKAVLTAGNHQPLAVLPWFLVKSFLQDFS